MPKIKEIIIKVIPQNKQRYPTLGDYWIEKDSLQVRVSEDADWRREWGIILHELFEYGIVLYRGIDIKKIDEYDINYRGNDPGTNPKAPYHTEHMSALEIEETFYNEVNYTGE
jgi:hypothetical protein